MSLGLKETWHRPGGSWSESLTKAILGTPAAVISCGETMVNSAWVEQLVGQPQPPLPAPCWNFVHGFCLRCAQATLTASQQFHLWPPSSAITGHWQKDLYTIYRYKCVSSTAVQSVWSCGGLGCLWLPLVLHHCSIYLSAWGWCVWKIHSST